VWQYVGVYTYFLKQRPPAPAVPCIVRSTSSTISLALAREASSRLSRERERGEGEALLGERREIQKEIETTEAPTRGYVVGTLRYYSSRSVARDTSCARLPGIQALLLGPFRSPAADRSLVLRTEQDRTDASLPYVPSIPRRIGPLQQSRIPNALPGYDSRHMLVSKTCFLLLALRPLLPV
jgi:hypothetical protein